MKIFLTIAFSSSFLFASVARADVRQTLADVRTQLASHDPEKKQKAISTLKKLAEAGSSDAAMGLGLAYAEGNGIARDAKEANKWYDKAADGGNLQALYGQSVRYRFGCPGASKDTLKGVQLLKRAREKANSLEKNEIDGLEKRLTPTNACGRNPVQDATATPAPKAKFELRSYKKFEFKKGAEANTRRTCPADHGNPNSRDRPYIDPKTYALETWCQCYLANMLQDTQNEASLAEQKMNFYAEACMKEAKRK